MRKDKTVIIREDILLANKYLRNQTQSTNKDYHFDTTGHSYGFGFGPVYLSNNETQHTVDSFAKSRLFN